MGGGNSLPSSIFGRCLIFECCMRTLVIVIINPFIRNDLQFGYVCWLVNEKELILVSSPKALHDNIIRPASFAVLADNYYADPRF